MHSIGSVLRRRFRCGSYSMLKLGFKFCADSFCSGSVLYILRVLYLNVLVEGYKIILMHDIFQKCMSCETFCILNKSQ